ncbi:MAG: translation elongation factor Ts, partial [Burkholderiaceae bacterium]
FMKFARDLAGLILKANPSDVAALSALPLGDGTVESVRTALVGKIGENLSVRRFARVETQGRLNSYVHGGSKIGALVDLNGGDAELGKDIAMHVAATKPKALDASGVPAEQIEVERRVAAEKAADDAAKSGKQIPADILAKRVDGTVAKFLKEVTLLGQPFVKDDKHTIEQLLKARGAKVNGFVLYVVGEGIEKKQTDFAAEVAATAAAARA